MKKACVTYKRPLHKLFNCLKPWKWFNLLLKN